MMEMDMGSKPKEEVDNYVSPVAKHRGYYTYQSSFLLKNIDAKYSNEDGKSEFTLNEAFYEDVLAYVLKALASSPPDDVHVRLREDAELKLTRITYTAYYTEWNPAQTAQTGSANNVFLQDVLNHLKSKSQDAFSESTIEGSGG